jgi:AAA15 family ATPase/GTPase
MKIKTIKVSGYRQLQDITIDLEDRITIVGGPNNSGKTSLIELFKWVFGKGANSKIERDDFPILSCQQWCNNIFPGIKKAFLSGKEKKLLSLMFVNCYFPSKKRRIPLQSNQSK